MPNAKPIAVIAMYQMIDALGFDGTPIPTRRLTFAKVIDRVLVEAGNETNPDAVSDWCARNRYVACGAVVGELEMPAVFWIESNAHRDGLRPEALVDVVGMSICGASVAFYRSDPGRPAHLATSIRGSRIRVMRSRNPNAADDDIGIVKQDSDRLMKSMLG